MKKAMTALLLVWLVLPLAVHAGPPVDVAGDFSYVPAIVSLKQAGDNLFLDATDTATWTGAFEGTSTKEYVAVLHGTSGGLNILDPAFTFEHASYKGTVTFTGEVQGREGTLEIRFVGKSLGDLADWTGTWRILSGTGELASLHGTGIFYNNTDSGGNKILGDIHYEGQVHFDPKK